jgi:hypothetical protein
MSHKIIWTAFYAGVMLAAVGAALWLTITGHTLQIGGLLLAMGSVLGAMLSGFRLAEGYGPGEISIWAGPWRSVRPAQPPLEPRPVVRKAA